MNNHLSLRQPFDSKKNTEVLIFVIITILLFIMATRTPMDSDMFWHLRVGEQTWNAGHPVLVDTFSYTRAGTVWTEQEWLGEVIFYLFYKLGGFPGMGLLVASLATISMVVVYLQLQAPPILKAFLITLATTVAAPVWTPRPEIFTLGFLALVSYVLYLYKWQNKNRLWLFIPIFILWSNIHGGYILGIGLIGLYILGEIINKILHFEGKEIFSIRKIETLCVWAAIAALVVLINPNGIRTWLIPFQTIHIQALQNYIQEWASPDFHQFNQQPFIWLLFLTMAAIGFSMKRLDGTDLLVFGAFGFLGLDARRNFGPFAIVVTPILARYLWLAIQAWVPKIKSDIQKITEKATLLRGVIKQNTEPIDPKKSRVINFSIVILLFIIAIGKLYITTSAPMIQSAYTQASIPVAAVNWIETNKPQGRIFDDYNWGGYLLWAMRDYPVFVDGRTDLYSDEIIGEYMKVANADVGWQEVLNQWNVNLIMISPEWPITLVLPYNGWKLLYQDNVAVIYGR